MRANSYFILAAGFLLMGVGVAVSSAANVDFKKAAIPFMEKHCIECHGGKQTKGDLDLKKFKDDRNILEDYKQWRTILHQVNTGEMPPKKYTNQPTHEAIQLFNDAVDTSLAKAEAKAKPDPGHITVRRLNRTEYNNTVRDLINVDFNPAENFPADDIGHGFDNIGDVLSISPVHLERYLDAAESISARAIALTLPKPPTHSTYSIFLSPNYRGSENSTRPVNNPESTLFTEAKLLEEGDYVFQVRAAATNGVPNSEPVRMTLIVGDKELVTVDVTNRVGRWKEYQASIHLPAGEHRIAARFSNRITNSDDRMLFINEFKVVGPADTRTAFQKKLDSLIAGKPEKDHAFIVTKWFLERAFRRPPTADEMARYLVVVQDGQKAANGNLQGGVQELIKSSLCSPKFLFRAELNDKPKTKDANPIDEYQLASRLSYFLWSSMPDDELIRLADTKLLSSRLEEQVARMLKDSKADSLVENFGMQWLQLQRLRSYAPDSSMFPSFNEGLRKSMQKETELFLREIMRENRSVLELVDADFTYLNETLARHYGITDTKGNRYGMKPSEKVPGGSPINGREFVRVSLSSKDRGGLLTQASILTVTSNPTRTSPVKRGKWVLEQILGTPPPPPPPGVSELEAQHELKGTLRQKMEQHRANPSCANCHKQMDALGFAFENFDAIGRFRTSDRDGAIDPAGELPDGSTFKGPGDLKEVLKGKKTLVARNVTEKLMTYALGRGLEFYDERAIKKVMADLEKADYKFSTLVTSIVTSDPFRLRRGKELNDKVAANNE